MVCAGLTKGERVRKQYLGNTNFTRSDENLGETGTRRESVREQLTTPILPNSICISTPSKSSPFSASLAIRIKKNNSELKNTGKKLFSPRKLRKKGRFSTPKPPKKNNSDTKTPKNNDSSRQNDVQTPTPKILTGAQGRYHSRSSRRRRSSPKRDISGPVVP